MDTAAPPTARHLLRRDPTQVLWRRIFAYAIDGLVGALLAAVIVVGFADLETVDGTSCPDDLPSGRVCLDTPDDDEAVLLADGGPIAVAAAATILLGLLNNVVLQGLTGATVGKFITAVRTVRADGRAPGLGRALVRTLLLVIDGISLILPLGLWVAMFSRGHRRLGDMVANTYVVHSQDAGTPVVLP